MEMYIVTHKLFSPPMLENYIPIQVGRLNTGVELGYLTDDRGCNISDKNPSFCELTALYWIWKNSQAETIGLCHYRRYFTNVFFSKRECFYLTSSMADKILAKYDIILPEKVRLKNTVQSKYSKSGAGFEKDLKNLENVMRRLTPDYVPYLQELLESREQYFWNMFVIKKDLLNEYCEWLFRILFELEKEIDISGYNAQQKRIYGYLAERLLNVWVEKNQLKIYTCPVIQSDKSLYRNIRTNVGIKLRIRKA